MVEKTFFDNSFRLIFSKLNYKDEDGNIKIKDNNDLIFIVTKINEVLNHYKNEEDGIPLQYTEYANFLIKLTSDILINGYKQDQVIKLLNKYNFTETIRQLIDYAIEIPLTEVDYITFLELLDLKHKEIKILKDKVKIEEFFDRVDNHDFTSTDEMLKSYEHILSDAYFDYITQKEGITNLLNDSDKRFPRRMSINSQSKDSNNVKTLLNNYFTYRNNIRILRSGFEIFDEKFSDGGYEPGRLYILTGTPGSGKSIFLLESIIKSALFYDSKLGENELTNGKKNLYLYLTAENQIYETLMRYSSMIVGAKTANLYKYQTEEATEKINKLATFNNSAIEIAYVDSYQTTTTDLLILIDNILKQYQKEFPDEYILRGIYIDYLDLFTHTDSSGNKEDAYRLELGKITMSFKKMGIYHNVPVITLTQLNDYYIDGKNKRPSLGNLTESRKKSEHADCVMFMYEHPEYVQYGRNVGDNEFSVDKRDAKLMVIEISKNRGQSTGSFEVAINYDNKRMYDVLLKNNIITDYGKYNELFNYKKILLKNNISINLTYECDSENNKLNVSRLIDMIKGMKTGDGCDIVKPGSFNNSNITTFDDYTPKIKGNMINNKNNIITENNSIPINNIQSNSIDNSYDDKIIVNDENKSITNNNGAVLF